MRRLNVWHRLLLVLTVVSIVGITFYAASSEFSADLRAWNTTRDSCLNRSDSAEAVGACWDAWSAEFDRSRAQSWWDSLGFAAGSVAFLWIVGLIIYGTIRWILAGRRPKISN